MNRPDQSSTRAGSTANRASLFSAALLVRSVSGRRSRRTLGFLLFLVLVAGGEGLPIRSRADQEVRAAVIELRPDVVVRLLRVRLPLAQNVGVHFAARRHTGQCPRWLDPTAGGRPPARAPDAHRTSRSDHAQPLRARSLYLT